MGTLALNADERVESVEFSEAFLVVGLKDGRRISVPIEWYPRLARASRGQLANWQVCGSGYGIHWPEIDKTSVRKASYGAHQHLTGHSTRTPASLVGQVRQ